MAAIGGFILYKKSQGNNLLEEFKSIVVEQTGLDINAVSIAVAGGTPPTTLPTDISDNKGKGGVNIDEIPDCLNDHFEAACTTRGCDHTLLYIRS